MTYEQLKEKLAERQTSTSYNPNACAYDNNGHRDPWDDEDEADILAQYSQYHPAAKTMLAETLKKEEEEAKKQPVKDITPEEKEEMDTFWQMLILLTECRQMIELLLQLDTRKDFLSPTNHKDLTDLLSNVEDIVDQYNMDSIQEHSDR